MLLLYVVHFGAKYSLPAAAQWCTRQAQTGRLPRHPLVLYVFTGLLSCHLAADCTVRRLPYLSEKAREIRVLEGTMYGGDTNC